METIRAAHNVTIELSPDRWRLLNGSRNADGSEPLALLEVGEHSVHCAPAFARLRRLPGADLEPGDVARVVVGWAPESENWHLGLLLAHTPDEGRRMRWCGLANWPPGSPEQHAAQARLAGQSLAELLRRPFNLIPPQTEPPIAPADTQAYERTTPIAAVQVPVVKLEARQTPPFEFDAMVMITVPRGYAWRMREQTLLTAVVRALVLSVLAIMFLVLGVGTETSGLAAVNPPWLPALGIAVAGLLIVIALRSFWALLTLTDVIVDTEMSEVRRQGRMTGRVRWRVPFDAIEYVLVSQTPSRAQGRRGDGDAMRTLQDVWLHIYDGSSFWEIAALEHVSGLAHDWERARTRQKTRGRRRLELANYDTPAHHAARVTADAIGTTLWLDIR